MRKILVVLAFLAMIPTGASAQQAAAGGDFSTKAAPYVIGAAIGAVAVPYLYPVAAATAGSALSVVASAGTSVVGSTVAFVESTLAATNSAITAMAPEAQVLIGAALGGAAAWWYGEKN
ncbi:MAG: hypothetical protein OHK0024_15230 [Thalassobaculales bacterium]